MIGSKGVSVVLFVLLTVLIFVKRPAFLVNEETGEWKAFGFGEGKSCVNVTVIIILLALGTYLISACTGAALCQFKTSLSKKKTGGGVSPEVVAPAEVAVPTSAAATPLPEVSVSPKVVKMTPAQVQTTFPPFGF